MITLRLHTAYISSNPTLSYQAKNDIGPYKSVHPIIHSEIPNTIFSKVHLLYHAPSHHYKPGPLSSCAIYLRAITNCLFLLLLNNQFSFHSLVWFFDWFSFIYRKWHINHNYYVSCLTTYTFYCLFFLYVVWLKVKLHRKDAPTEKIEAEKQGLVFAIEKAFNESPKHEIVVLLDMTACGMANLVSCGQLVMCNRELMGCLRQCHRRNSYNGQRRKC